MRSGYGHTCLAAERSCEKIQSGTFLNTHSVFSGATESLLDLILAKECKTLLQRLNKKLQGCEGKKFIYMSTVKFTSGVGGIK